MSIPGSINIALLTEGRTLSLPGSINIALLTEGEQAQANSLLQSTILLPAVAASAIIDEGTFLSPLAV